MPNKNINLKEILAYKQISSKKGSESKFYKSAKNCQKVFGSYF